MKKFTFLFCLSAIIFFAFQSPKRTIFMVGDSTMANKSVKAFPETGWGQALSAFVDTSRIVVDNHAKNGRSTKSFIDEGLWQAVVDKIKPGDYVFIQFGHNDEKINKPAVYARAETAYKVNLKKMIDDTKGKGGVPVLFSSIVRRDFLPNGKLNDTHGAYIDAVRQVAADEKVAFVDLEAETHLMVERLGPDASCRLYLHVDSAQYSHRPKAIADNTHLSRYGAIEVAALAVKSIKKQIPELADFF